MSEFTNGYVLLASDKDKLETHFEALSLMKKDYIPQPLNTKYLGLFIDVSTILDELALHIWAMNCSNQFPIMYFDNAEDHGWTYKLYSEGQLGSQITVNYGLEDEMVFKLLEKELGHHDVGEYYAHNDMDAYYEKVHASRAYKQAIKAMYSNLNLSAFRVFGIDSEKIQQLKSILTSTSYHVFEERKRQVIKFKEIIGIPEMEWISYRYLKRDKDKGQK
jgi:hypothetical protein